MICREIQIDWTANIDKTCVECSVGKNFICLVILRLFIVSLFVVSEYFRIEMMILKIEEIEETVNYAKRAHTLTALNSASYTSVSHAPAARIKQLLNRNLLL